MRSWLQVLVAIVVVPITVSGCRPVADGPAPTSQSAAPPATAPQWPTAGDWESLDEEAIDDLDVFVTMAFFSTVDEFGFQRSASVDQMRTEAMSAPVLHAKYALAQLFYNVSFDKALHPVDDPQFYLALVEFERAAGLSVDGMFTVAEWEQLLYLADLQTEQTISMPFKNVYGDGRSYASASGT